MTAKAALMFGGIEKPGGVLQRPPVQAA